MSTFEEAKQGWLHSKKVQNTSWGRNCFLAFDPIGDKWYAMNVKNCSVGEVDDSDINSEDWVIE